MRPKPSARGGCHRPNDVADTTFATLLVSDVHGSYSITMSPPATCAVGAMEHAPLGFAFASMPTDRTRLARVAFLLQYHLYSSPFSFRGERLPDGTKGPLREFLSVCAANIQGVPNIAHSTDCQELHALLTQRGHHSGRLLMFDLLDGMFQRVHLPLL